ncbi:MAG: FAD binding domain-containing protein [Chloroflexota bacterium]|nr:MAG: oxidoreductase [Bellilinea sp.]
MIKEYYRPKTVSEAEQLFKRGDNKFVPLGGGSVLSRSKEEDLCVVDLQELGLNQVEVVGHKAILGATVTLQQLIESDSIPIHLKEVIRRSATINIRNQATLGGYVVSTDGRSPLGIALMAMDAVLIWHPNQETQSLGDWFSIRQPRGYWIKGIQFNLNVELAYEQVSRTPMDQPILAVAIARWASGRVRIAIGGFGKSPILVLDGPEDSGLIEAVKNALSDSGDEWASAEYRQAVGEVLVRRMMNKNASDYQG